LLVALLYYIKIFAIQALKEKMKSHNNVWEILNHTQLFSAHRRVAAGRNVQLFPNRSSAIIAELGNSSTKHQPVAQQL